MATIKELQTNTCAVVEAAAEEEQCEECVPNSLAIVPDWTTVSINQPYLNEKTCEYELAIENFGDVNSTPITAASDSDIESANDELISIGLTIILEYYGKNVSEDDTEALTTATYVKDTRSPWFV